MDINIRLASLEDAPEITQLGMELFGLHQGFDPEVYEMPQDFSEKYWDWVIKQISSPDSFVLIAQKQEEKASNPLTCGFISGYVKSFYPFVKIKSAGQISFIYVMESMQRQGVGTKLLEACLIWFKERGINLIELQAEHNNEKGLAFWSKKNFSERKKILRRILG